MVVVPAVWCLIEFDHFNRSHLRIKNNNPHYAFSASTTRARRASWIKEENSVYGLRHCNITGCLRQELGVPSGQRHEICRGLHAEQNALLQAARYGINIEGASIYITTQPCVVCAKMLINAGIKEIIYKNPYPDELAMEMLEESGIKMRVFEEE